MASSGIGLNVSLSHNRLCNTDQNQLVKNFARVSHICHSIGIFVSFFPFGLNFTNLFKINAFNMKFLFQVICIFAVLCKAIITLTTHSGFVFVFFLLT